MKKITLILSLITFVYKGFGQTSDPVKENYEKAFDELHQMIRGEIPMSFKRAVYLTENAFLDNKVLYDDYLKELGGLVRLTKAVAASDAPLYLKYEGKDCRQLLLSSSIYRALKDSLFFENPDKTKTLIKIPYTYDLEDFWGEHNWTKMFVTKILYTHSGNCHGLPALYKILADDLGVKAYLALAPNHTYIKQWNDKMGWYNTELTTGQFPVDAEIKFNSYIKTETIASGVYMDTLSQKETLAYVITDLAQGYIKKFGHEDADLPLGWLDTALSYYPDYINALILRAELEKKNYEKIMTQNAVSHYSELWRNAGYKGKFDALEQEYLNIHQLGYRRMPKEMYLNWLFRVQKDSTHKPYKFTPPQPFEKYNYTVQVMTAGNGENSEFFDQDTVVQIGTIKLNIISGRIVKFIEYQPAEIPDEIISRMYDPALGRFWQIDPMAEDFYPATPYNYAFNNPVNIIDPDGRSGEPVIDGKNKTITVNVHIVFYGTGATDDNMKVALATINDMWNANADKEGWSDGGDGWRIKVNATGEVTDEAGAEQIAEDNEGNALYNFVRVEKETGTRGEDGEQISGMSEHTGNSGMWATRDMKDTTPAHEIGHGFGLSTMWHDNAEGIMVAGTDNRKVTSGNMSELRSNMLNDNRPKISLISQYLSPLVEKFTNVKIKNYGSTNTVIYNAEGKPKN